MRCSATAGSAQPWTRPRGRVAARPAVPPDASRASGPRADLQNGDRRRRGTHRQPSGSAGRTGSRRARSPGAGRHARESHAAAARHGLGERCSIRADRVGHARTAEHVRRPVPPRRSRRHTSPRCGRTARPTTARSWETSSRPCLPRAAGRRAARRISAWTMTSSAVVGSSASSRVGRRRERHGDHDPLAHPAAELVRIGAGAAPRRRGCRPAPSSRSARPGARARPMPSWDGSPARSPRRPRSTGLSAVIGSWKIIAMRAPRSALHLRSSRPRSPRPRTRSAR